MVVVVVVGVVVVGVVVVVVVVVVVIGGGGGDCGSGGRWRWYKPAKGPYEDPRTLVHSCYFK